MVDPRPWEPYENPFYDFSDDQLADAYVQYMDATNTHHFSEIFWEASRRGLSLDELEGIHASNHYDPPCSIDSSLH